MTTSNTVTLWHPPIFTASNTHVIRTNLRSNISPTFTCMLFKEELPLFEKTQWPALIKTGPTKYLCCFTRASILAATSSHSLVKDSSWGVVRPLSSCGVSEHERDLSWLLCARHTAAYCTMLSSRQRCRRHLSWNYREYANRRRLMLHILKYADWVIS